jgi:hypothetical protein
MISLHPKDTRIEQVESLTSGQTEQSHQDLVADFDKVRLSITDWDPAKQE